MKPTDNIFTAQEIAAVVGVNPDETTRKRDSYSALNGVHFALVKALTDFGLSDAMAVEFAFGIGFAASTAEDRGTVLIRRSDPAGSWEHDGPIWVDLDTHELAMYSEVGAPEISGQKVCMAINVASIEADVIRRLDAVAAQRQSV